MTRNDRWLPGLDDGPGPAPSISDARAGELVDTALESAFAPAPSPRVRRVPRALAHGGLAAIAAAVTVVAALRWTRHSPQAPKLSHAPATDASALLAPSPSAPASEPLPSPADTPTGGTALAASRAPRAPASVTDLLAHANDLRAARRWRDAAQAYERVLSSQPASPEAYAATVAAADLHLEQLHDPAGALRLYRKAQGAPNAGGRLGEQVLWGIAQSARALAESSAEAAALRDYVSQYPAGLFVTGARARLAELAGKP